MLQRGALRVVALDVGHGQLDWRLRQDPRVVVLEHVNAPFSQLPFEKVPLAAIERSECAVGSHSVLKSPDTRSVGTARNCSATGEKFDGLRDVKLLWYCRSYCAARASV